MHWQRPDKTHRAQLFLKRDPGGYRRIGNPTVPRGAVQTADLERRDICRAEMGKRSGSAFPVRKGGSARPLPSFRDRVAPKKDGTGLPLTPTGVFLLSSIPYQDFLFPVRWVVNGAKNCGSVNKEKGYAKPVWKKACKNIPVNGV